EIQYNSDGSFKWGFQIPADGERHKWFKLALDPESTANIDIGQAKYYIDHQAAPPRYNQEPEEIVKDYLTALRRHLEAVLQKTLPQSVVSSTPVDYILTVPAIWTDTAVAKTRTCAELAGMKSLKIVSEPEAAAIWALQQVTPGSFDNGDTFVVCDAGGGTVDLISYKVTGLKPILKVAEVAPGQVKKCGSTFLNRRFEAFLREKLSSHPSWQEHMMEDIKRSYDGTETSQYDVPVPTFPDDADYNVRRARYTLKGSDLHQIFEPIIKDIIDLVWHQIQATRAAKTNVKAVLLVGGFSESNYLFKRLQQSVAPEGIEVHKSPNGSV
ncbi:MAG: hypothetical protein Q9169_008631, partial [Polycauliona sp. 2 TL-2023]